MRNPLRPWPPRPLAGQGRSTPRPSPSLRLHRLNVGGAGILNLLPIVYAVRPRLRTRLTLGGRTFPRKPWVYGGQGFHLSYRYSCLHPHFPSLHHAVTRRLQCNRNAPLPLVLLRIQSFGIMLIANHGLQLLHRRRIRQVQQPHQLLQRLQLHLRHTTSSIRILLPRCPILQQHLPLQTHLP